MFAFTHIHTHFSRCGLATAAVCATALALLMQGGAAHAAVLALG